MFLSPGGKGSIRKRVVRAFSAISPIFGGSPDPKNTTGVAINLNGGIIQNANASVVSMIILNDTGSAGVGWIISPGTGTGDRTRFQFFNTNSGNVMYLSSTDASVHFSNKVLSVNPTGGVGYENGAGGTVTQATSKSTGVTLNNICGQITTNNAALAAATIVTFNVTCAAMAAADVVIMNHASGGTLAAYTINPRANTTGNFAVDIRNNTAGSLSEALVLNYAIIKAVQS